MKNEIENKAIECPSCWGRQEYNGKEYLPVFRAVVTGKNAKSKLGWINAYARKYLDASKRADRNQRFISPISYRPI